MNQYLWDNLEPSDTFLGSYDYGRTCCTCQEHELQKDDLADYLKQVVDNLYGNKIDNDDLTHALSQMAWLLGLSDVRNTLAERKLACN